MLLKKSDMERVVLDGKRGREQLRYDVADLTSRVDSLESELGNQMLQTEKWRSWMTVLTFGMGTASLILAGVYLGGVLF